VSAGRDFQRIGRQRLHPIDLYHLIDWLREAWTEDERDVAVQLSRLEWHVREMPSRYHDRALDQIAVVKRARIVDGVPWSEALSDLRRIVSEWGRELKAAA
jgi:hypothetical protein